MNIHIFNKKSKSKREESWGLTKIEMRKREKDKIRKEQQGVDTWVNLYFYKFILNFFIKYFELSKIKYI